MTKEALKLALELLESAHVATDLVWKRHDAVEAIKEALAQPDYRAVKTYHEGKPVYVAQPEQEPVAYIRVSKTGNVMACAKTGDFYKLPDKTLLYTSPQHPQQEQNLNCKSTQARLATAWGFTKVLDISDKRLMEMPPRREWVGLTDEEREAVVNNSMTPVCVAIAIEAKLRSKNND